MGIRYYAYAFDEDRTESALANPHAFVSSDPLADAWGFEPHARVATPTFEQVIPERDMLYLDKAWRPLQLLTGPSPATAVARPAYRMFEGDVAMRPGGWTWDPWVRVLTPPEIEPIAQDLRDLTSGEALRRLPEVRVRDDDVAYALQFLDRAHRFVDGLARECRGMVYLIA